MDGWMDGRMDTCREIPDLELWLRIGSRCIGSRVRNASRLVDRQPALFAGGPGSCCESGSGQKCQSRTIWNFHVAFALFCSTDMALLGHCMAGMGRQN